MSAAPPGPTTRGALDGSLLVFHAFLYDEEEWAKLCSSRPMPEEGAATDAFAKMQAAGIFGDARLRAYRMEDSPAAPLRSAVSDRIRCRAVGIECSGLLPQRVLALAAVQLEVEGLGVDEGIALTLSATRKGEELSEALGHLVFEAGRAPDLEGFWCWEIRRMGGGPTAAELVESRKGELYGLLMGDEGWRYVPSARTEQALDDAWSTRDYLTVLAQPSAALVVNLAERRTQERVASADTVRELIGLSLPHHSSLPGAIAGTDHGALHALAGGLSRKIESQRLEQELPKLVERRRLDSLRITRYKRHRDARKSLYAGLLRIGPGPIPEISALVGFLDERLGVTSAVDRLMRAASLIDMEVRDDRTFLINVIATVLTLTAIAIAVSQWAL
jgi:hypothetical protein